MLAILNCVARLNTTILVTVPCVARLKYDNITYFNVSEDFFVFKVFAHTESC